MNAEKMMDAMNLLPDDLLEATNALRTRKRTYWKPILALAACLCLVVGLWFINPGAKAEDSASGRGEESGEPFGHLLDRYDASTSDTHKESTVITQHSFAGAEYVDVTVVMVRGDYVGVVEGWRENYAIDGFGTWVTLANLDQIPDLKPGQYLRIYFGETLEGYVDPTEAELVLIPESIELWSVTE